MLVNASGACSAGGALRPRHGAPAPCAASPMKLNSTETKPVPPACPQLTFRFELTCVKSVTSTSSRTPSRTYHALLASCSSASLRARRSSASAASAARARHQLVQSTRRVHRGPRGDELDEQAAEAAKKRAEDEKDPKKQYEIFVIFAICILGYLILDGVFFNIFLD